MYAHGASELKNRPVVNTVEYLKSKVKKPAQDNSKLSEDLTLNDGDHDVCLSILYLHRLNTECRLCFYFFEVVVHFITPFYSH